ncbi:MAG: hypothetical protein OEY77_13920 [Nitrospira sp.]|nr:hypothetical protein [Nitrospira sp.]
MADWLQAPPSNMMWAECLEMDGLVGYLGEESQPLVLLDYAFRLVLEGASLFGLQ